MLTKEQLDAIKARVVNTTPGAWRIDKKSDSRAYITDVWMDGEDNGLIEVHRFGESSKYNDAEFIAHARQDVPALIAEVERLQKVLKNTDADLYVYKDLYDEMTDKNIELIKFLQTRITKGWGQKAVDLAMIHIQEQEKEVERLQKQHDALEFHLKVSSKALESEGEKADAFQRALEKIYDDIGILTSQEIFRIVEDALEGTMPLGGDDDE